MLESRTVNTSDFSGDFSSGIALLKIFDWYEWVIIFIVIGLIFKYLGKYFILNSPADEKKDILK